MPISEKQFQTIFKESLGGSFEKSFSVFKMIGKHFSIDFAGLLFKFTDDKEKVAEILSTVEKYWRKNKELSELEKIPIESRVLLITKTRKIFSPEKFL